MGLGKILAYTVGGVALGVGAVAAAPFTGGGSLLGGASIIASLAGAGVVAGVAGVAGAAGGAVVQNFEDKKTEQKVRMRRHIVLWTV